MVTETNSQGVLDTKAESMLRELFKADMTCVRPGVWKFGDGESALWAVYLPDAGPTRKEEGERNELESWEDSPPPLATSEVSSQVYRRQGQRCKICNSVIRMVRLAPSKRATYFCARCQR